MQAKSNSVSPRFTGLNNNIASVFGPANKNDRHNSHKQGSWSFWRSNLGPEGLPFRWHQRDDWPRPEAGPVPAP